MLKPQVTFTFKSGLPGLAEEIREFAFYQLQKESPFYLLESIDNENICFILINPFDFFPNYEFELLEDDKDKINVEDIKDLAIFCIINASRGIKEATVNLLAPIVVNTSNGLARQIILDNNSYDLRQPLPLSTKVQEG